MLVWCDLETTGLEPTTGSILEIALVATDDDLNEIGDPFVSLVRPLDGRGIEAMDDFVREMHTKNGLLAQIYDGPPGDCLLKPGLLSPWTVADQAVNWVVARTGLVFDEAKKLLRQTPLAGSTVHFDKNWLYHHMPVFEGLFSHRTADVSSLNEWYRRWKRELWAGRPGADATGEQKNRAHRALDDIRASIETARYYRGARA